jgi:hypothetical protein
MKTVFKDGKTVFYEDYSLLYGAIFSEPEVYECQVKRLMKRASELALLYSSKSEIVAARAEGCSSNLQGDLGRFADVSAQINNSIDLEKLYFTSESLRNENSRITTCRLWED